MNSRGTARLVGADDWETWRELRLRALEDTPDAFGSTYERELVFGEGEWRQRLSHGPRVLVYDDGVPASMGGGFPFEGAAFVFGMWTDPALRGRGHARLVLDEVVGWARAEDRPLALHVNVTNTDALAFYARYGFVATGELDELRPGSDQLIELMKYAGSGASG